MSWAKVRMLVLDVLVGTSRSTHKRLGVESLKTNWWSCHILIFNSHYWLVSVRYTQYLASMWKNSMDPMEDLSQDRGITEKINKTEIMLLNVISYYNTWFAVFIYFEKAGQKTLLDFGPGFWTSLLIQLPCVKALATSQNFFFSFLWL